VQVVRQGRAALTTTVQMFKILGLNCLVSAFALSVQYLDGVKWGDTQQTVVRFSHYECRSLLAR
jgi:cation-transporting ATPase 13A1